MGADALCAPYDDDDDGGERACVRPGTDARARRITNTTVFASV